MADQTPQLPPFDFGKLLKAIQLLAAYETAHPGAIRDLVALVPELVAIFSAA